MADVAQAAGVSHQTVWRVINDAPNVSPRTRERILAVIDRLGYRRNQAARSLVLNRSSTIGVLGPAEPDYGPTRSMFSVEHAIRAAGYHPLITSAAPEQAAETLDFLLEQSIEALIVIASHRRILSAVDALRSELPVVTLQTGGSATGLNVSIDQRHGVRAVVRHLTQLGHERIQHIAGPLDFLEAEIRRDAFVREVRGTVSEALPVLVGDWSPDSGYRLAERLEPDVTAVVCGNDQMALGALHALHVAGRRVPEELSVVGFDDIPEAAHSLPPLTTVHQDFERVGREAVRALLEQLEGDERRAIRPLRPRLMVRDSTAGAQH
jgi:DNA-binding LacI/PurR family transcriptional regulator